MASLEDLKDETLDNRGVMDKMRAMLRAEIFNALEDKESPKPHLTNENLIINELIREYLEFNQYKHSLSVFLPETGQPKEPLQRKFLAKETNMIDDPTTTKVPLLYTILTKLQDASLPPSSEYPLPHFDMSRSTMNQFSESNNNSNYNMSSQQPKKASTAAPKTRQPPTHSFHAPPHSVHPPSSAHPSHPSHPSSARSFGPPPAHSHSHPYSHGHGHAGSSSPDPLYDDDAPPLVFKHNNK